MFRPVVRELNEAHKRGIYIKLLPHNSVVGVLWCERYKVPFRWTRGTRWVDPVTSTFREGKTYTRNMMILRDQEGLEELEQIHWDHAVWAEQEEMVDADGNTWVEHGRRVMWV